VLKISDNIGDMGGIRYELALCLLACWVIVFIALVKGVESLGKISYFTATVPYVILTALVINGALLEGSIDGVYYYIGSVDVKKFSDPIVYKNAVGSL
jgi:SNF family Na+-dependent transporter